MYNNGVNDNMTQIKNIKIYSTTNNNNNIFTNTVINMVMEITYDNTSNISLIETESFSITEENFDISYCYLYNFKKINNNKVLFNLEPSSSLHKFKISVIEDSILRNVNNRLKIKSNPLSNIFEYKYDDLPLNIIKIYSDNVNNDMYTNKDNINVLIEFSEEVYNFTEDFIKCDNCKIININKNEKGYCISLKTEYNSKASIKIVNNLLINVGLYYQKCIENIKTFSWNCYNISPKLSIISSHKNNDINNNKYLDINIKITTPILKFVSSDVIIIGNAFISSFKGNGEDYEIRITPNMSGNIIIKFSITDIHGNKSIANTVFNWFYDNILPSIELITNNDFLLFLSNKELIDFKSSDIEITNGKISNLKEVDKYFNNKIKYKVTVGCRTENNNYYNNKGSKSYYLDGNESPMLTFYPKTTYIFDQSDITNKDYKILFYKDAEKTIPYNDIDNILFNNKLPGTIGSYTIIYINNNSPINLFYECENDYYMGNRICKGIIYECKLITNDSNIDICIDDKVIKDKYGNINNKKIYYNICI